MRSFHIAGSLAFQDALKKAKPVLLEPIMRVEVVTPEEYMGAVNGAGSRLQLLMRFDCFLGRLSTVRGNLLSANTDLFDGLVKFAPNGTICRSLAVGKA